ncbi:XRE family transcriptional regulator [Streptomyces fungicidicus]|uniref:XRE family transcriptional regulator n=1 Tax=Streptomyces fungicidicus TaxID=68203 RepID=UPI0036B7B813
MGANLVLQRRLDQLGFTQEELAARLNAALQEITGRPGEISSRTVRNLLNGSSRRPIGRTCAALERVFGCPVADLGFSAPSSMQHPPEGPVRRRDFIVSTTGTAAAAVPVVKQLRSVGMADVARASASMNQLVKADDRQGGHASLATAALEARAKVLELQQRNASERVRRALYALAAEFTTIAAWSCIDLRALDTAQTYLHESSTFAGLSQDPPTGMRVWVNMAMLAYQRKNWPEQLAAAQAANASPAARRDPFFGSMGRVRLALAHSSLGDLRAARRALGKRKRPSGRRPRTSVPGGPRSTGRPNSTTSRRSSSTATENPPKPRRWRTERWRKSRRSSSATARWPPANSRWHNSARESPSRPQRPRPPSSRSWRALHCLGACAP